MTKISFDELFDIIESYRYEQECIMDACDDTNSYEYISASSKWNAIQKLRHILGRKELEILGLQHLISEVNDNEKK